MTTIQKAAYHQAGHAVVACLKAIPFKRVSIKPRAARTPLQFPRFVSPDVDPWNPYWKMKLARKFWARFIAAYIAGSLAEALSQDPPERHAVDASNDAFTAAVIADYFYEPRRALRWLNDVRAQTLNTLAYPDTWSAVQAVADALMKRGTLSCAQVRGIVQQYTTLGGYGAWVSRFSA